jgi:uncharacterized protein
MCGGWLGNGAVRLAGLLLALAALLAGASPVRAQEVLPVPPLGGRVIDQTSTLTPAQAAALTDKLAAIEARNGAQIVVLIVASTAPEDIAAYAQRVGDAWKIGRREVGDGLVVVVAKNDRRVRIEVAKALEGAVPDLAARRIITETITPAFRAGDFAGGLNAGIDALAARIAGEGLPAPDARRADGGLLQGFDWQDLAIFFFFALPIVATVARGIFGRKLGSLAAAGAVGGIAWVVTTSVLVALVAGFIALVVAALGGFGGGSRGRRLRGHHAPSVIFGGGGGWGGDGGGFGSGGGGDFGGGGASGDW